MNWERSFSVKFLIVYHQFDSIASNIGCGDFVVVKMRLHRKFSLELLVMNKLVPYE